MSDIFADFAEAPVSYPCSDFSINDKWFTLAETIGRDFEISSMSRNLRSGASYNGEQHSLCDRDFHLVVTAGDTISNASSGALYPGVTETVEDVNPKMKVSTFAISWLI